MKENQKKSVPEEKLEQITGGGAFDDVPTVNEKDYDEYTKIIGTSAKN